MTLAFCAAAMIIRLTITASDASVRTTGLVVEWTAAVATRACTIASSFGTSSLSDVRVNMPPLSVSMVNSPVNRAAARVNAR